MSNKTHVFGEYSIMCALNSPVQKVTGKHMRPRSDFMSILSILKCLYLHMTNDKLLNTVSWDLNSPFEEAETLQGNRIAIE